MSKNPRLQAGTLLRHGSLTGRLESVRGINASSSARCHYSVNIQQIADALVVDGYTTLDAQAKALGIHRATAWTIIRAKHKLGRLNSKTIDRMLANPDLPHSVRAVLESYVAERI
jgi:hypothetical protein